MDHVAGTYTPRTRNYMKTQLIQIFFRMQKYNYLMNEKENEMQKDRNYFSYRMMAGISFVQPSPPQPEFKKTIQQTRTTKN